MVTFGDQFYKGETAATRKDYSKGNVTFLGVVTNDFKLERDVVRDIFRQAYIPVKDYPEGVIIDWYNGIWIGVNYSDKTYAINKTTAIVERHQRTLAGRGSVWRD